MTTHWQIKNMYMKIEAFSQENLYIVYCKRCYFRWGKISRKCWQDISRGGNFHDTTHISFIKAYGFYFRVGVIFTKNTKARKTRKLPPRENFHVYSIFFKGYSTKQNPHGVFFTLSSPIMILLMSPHLPNNSWICSSVVKYDRLPTYNVVDINSAFSCSDLFPCKIIYMYNYYNIVLYWFHTIVYILLFLKILYSIHFLQCIYLGHMQN